MRYCEKCKVAVEGSRKYCPLCQAETRCIDEDSRETFPLIPTVYKKYNLFFRILIFASVVAGVVSVLINMLIPTRIWWSFFVLLGIGSMWITLAIAVRKRRNIPKTVLYQVVVISLLAVLWDAITGWHSWSLDYVLPIVCTFAMIAMSIIARVLNLHFEDFVIYILIDAVFGIIPVVFLLFGHLRVPLPSLFCVAGSIISLSALFLFEGERIKTELKRRLHL